MNFDNEDLLDFLTCRFLTGDYRQSVLIFCFGRILRVFMSEETINCEAWFPVLNIP